MEEKGPEQYTLHTSINAKVWGLYCKGPRDREVAGTGKVAGRGDGKEGKGPQQDRFSHKPLKRGACRRWTSRTKNRDAKGEMRERKRCRSTSLGTAA